MFAHWHLTSVKVKDNNFTFLKKNLQLVNVNVIDSWASLLIGKEGACLGNATSWLRLLITVLQTLAADDIERRWQRIQLWYFGFALVWLGLFFHHQTITCSGNKWYFRIRQARASWLASNLSRYLSSRTHRSLYYYIIIISSTLLFVCCSCPAQRLVDENSLMMTTAVSFK